VPFMLQNPPPAAAVPRFALYGETAALPSAGFVHVELIETRSRLHDWHISRHTHGGLFQVLFLTHGQVTAWLDDTAHVCEGPVALTVAPDVVHGFDFSPEAQGFVLTMDQQVIFSAADVFAGLFLQPAVIDMGHADDIRQRLESLCRHLLTECSWPLFGQTLMLEWLARSALLLLLRLQSDRHFADSGARNDFALFSRFRQLVDDNYEQQHAIGWYAGKLHVTSSRLNRLCMKIAGKSAFALTQDRLMREACRNLTYSPAGIAAIAYGLGFQDPAYFSRLFKRLAGVTPKQFRERSTAAPPALPVS
jgi:AraC family transcriptional activator of pobA